MSIVFNNDIAQLETLPIGTEILFKTHFGEEIKNFGKILEGKNTPKIVLSDGLYYLFDEISEFFILDFNEYKDRYLGKDSPFEVRKVWAACKVGVYIGNAMKYIARADKKGNRKADIKKCIDYLKYTLESPIDHDYVHLENNPFTYLQVAAAWGLDEKLTEALKLIWHGYIYLAIECLSTC